MADSSCVSVRILLVLLMLDSVYCQINAYAGSNVPLSCSYTAASKLSVYWRYRDTYNLVDIINGRVDLSAQHQRFRDRIDTSSSDLIAKGDFSVVLKNVKLNDSGPYNCDIPEVDYQRQLQLTVTVKPVKPTGDGVSVRGHAYCFIISSLTLLLSM